MASTITSATAAVMRIRPTRRACRARVFRGGIGTRGHSFIVRSSRGELLRGTALNLLTLNLYINV